MVRTETGLSFLTSIKLYCLVKNQFTWLFSIFYAFCLFNHLLQNLYLKIFSEDKCLEERVS